MTDPQPLTDIPKRAVITSSKNIPILTVTQSDTGTQLSYALTPGEFAELLGSLLNNLAYLQTFTNWPGAYVGPRKPIDLCIHVSGDIFTGFNIRGPFLTQDIAEDYRVNEDENGVVARLALPPDMSDDDA